MMKARLLSISAKVQEGLVQANWSGLFPVRKRHRHWLHESQPAISLSHLCFPSKSLRQKIPNQILSVSSAYLCPAQMVSRPFWACRRHAIPSGCRRPTKSRQQRRMPRIRFSFCGSSLLLLQPVVAHDPFHALVGFP